MSEGPSPTERFWSLPPDAVHADHLMRCLPGLTAEAALRAQACGRAHPRLSALIRAACPLPPPEPDAFARRAARLALRSGAELSAISRLCGVAWHGASIRRAIGRAEVARLTAVLGAPARAFALRNPDLSGAPAAGGSVEDLLAAVEAAGPRCMEVWRGDLPGSAGERFRLTMPVAAFAEPGAPGPERSDAPRVVAILDRIAQEIGEDDDA